MSQLTIYPENAPGTPELQTRDTAEIGQALNAIGVRFEQWQTRDDVRAGDDPQRILDAYQADIQRLVDEQGYQSCDVVSLSADHPDKAVFRQKFLSEHTHSEDEVRFFVDGQGLFSLRKAQRVFEVLCTRGDLISVPANTRHWFDMGPNPSFVAIRLFNNPEGWVANFTGDNIAERFNRLEN